jgi:lipoprotein-anchoring transpeptidase ErfK/SrfK
MMESEHTSPADARAGDGDCSLTQPMAVEKHPSSPVTGGDGKSVPSGSRGLRSVLLALGATVLLSSLVCLFIASAAPFLRDVTWIFSRPKTLVSDAKTQKHGTPLTCKKQLKRVTSLQQKLARLTPDEPYLIVNTFKNEILLKRGNDTIRTGYCSTGSYVLLKTADEKKWVFSTPRGMYRVQSKMEAPVWRRPDWSFIEEGRPIPSADSPERYQPGVLGDYALTLGHGYMIHGTLYKRFIGLPVTHGCIRLGDEDLEVVFKNLRVGSKVFIY